MRTSPYLWFVLLVGCTGTIVDLGPNPGDDDDDDDDVRPRPDAAAPAPDAAPPQMPQAAGIRIRGISVYQGVEIPIVENGAAVAESQRRSSVVEGADALIGVFVDLDPEWQTREVLGRLEIERGPEDVRTYTVTETITAASGEDPFASGFAFVVDGDDITVDARFSVSLEEIGVDSGHPGSTDGARYPAGAGERVALEVRSIHGPFRLVLVPFAYNSDGSGRLPPIDEAALQQYRDLFLAMYPIGDIELTVRDPVEYSGSISGGGGWSSWLDALTSIRDDDDPPPNTYYYGIAAPRDTFSAFCNGGCIIGLGWVPGRDDGYGRAAVGVSFPERLGLYTSAHEVGHTTGRSHAPCGGPSGVDWSYPYPGAAIGVWGYDNVDQALKAPNEYSDVMGYCSDQWISDYTYDGILERLAYVNQLAATAAAAAPQRYRVGLVDGDGRVTWRRYDDIRARVGGEQVPVSLVGADGGELESVTARLYRYDHLDGGMLLVPVANGPAPAAARIDGIGTVAW